MIMDDWLMTLANAIFGPKRPEITDAVTGVVELEPIRIEGDPEAVPGRMPAIPNWSVIREMGTAGDAELMAQATKNPAMAIKQSLAAGLVDAKRVAEFYQTEGGKKVAAFQDALEDEFGEPGSGATFEMMPMAELTEEEEIQREENKFFNLENLRLRGLSGDFAVEQGYPREMLPREHRGRGRVMQPSVYDMAVTSGEWGAPVPRYKR